MKEIVIISGKGGTGKTSITASFAALGGSDIVVADCDVDAADMHLLMQPDFAEAENFYSGETAVIDQDKCLQCGQCAAICRFSAIQITDGMHEVSELDCEGCGYCARVCPAGAIEMVEQKVGQFFISATRAGNQMVHARLGIGAENSGKLVAKVKKEAKTLAENTQKELVVVDGSPGIGCPVVSSLSGADFVVLVTEPTISGLHDLKRVYELIQKFHIDAGCIINKADLNQAVCRQIELFLADENILHIANLPYDETFTRAMTQGQTIVEFDEGRLRDLLVESWEALNSRLNVKS